MRLLHRHKWSPLRIPTSLTPPNGVVLTELRHILNYQALNGGRVFINRPLYTELNYKYIVATETMSIKWLARQGSNLRQSP